MRKQRALALAIAIACLSAAGAGGFAQSRTVYSKDGLTLSYELYPKGSRDVTVQPGVTEKMQYFEFRAVLVNNSGKDVKLNGSANVSFFSVSTKWTDGGGGEVAFSPGALKNGASLEGRSSFLLNPSYASPGTPLWSVPAYSFIASAASAPAEPEKMGNAALLDRYATLYKGFKAGSSSAADNEELRALTMEIINRTQAGKFSPEELQRYLDTMKN